MNKEALYYFEENNEIKCRLCPHNCTIHEGKKGACNVREAKRDNSGKLKLYALNYGEITSISLDPIEKKPLYEFCPGTYILSIGSFGCNFRCTFCQNYTISQYKPDSKFVPSDHMAEISLSTESNIGLAFTYNEPSIWYEYVLDVSREIKKMNKEHKIVLVTNGYINEKPLRELLPYVDAMNIDLKGGEEYYKKLCFGTLKDVKNTIRIASEMGCHVEVTTLLIPGENTDKETLHDIGSFLKSINNNIPVHLSRYFPRYKMEKGATPLEMIRDSYKILKSYLDNIYLGNLSPEDIEFCTK